MRNRLHVKNRTLMFYMLVVTWLAFMFGVVIPALVSAKDDILAMAGLALVLMHVVIAVLFINANFFSKTGESHEDK